MALRMRSPLPSLEGAAAWLNGGIDAEALRDKPVVVSFWSKSCYLCHESAEQFNAWREKFAKAGVRVRFDPSTALGRRARRRCGECRCAR